MDDRQTIDNQAGGLAPGTFDARALAPGDVLKKSGEDNVLVVDDDQLFCRQLSSGLKRYGLATLSADNRQLALETVQVHRPHFAILELRLLHDPNAFHSGLDLISKLRRLNPPMRIVVATAYSSIVTAVAAIKRGAADYMLKPVDVHTVAAALTRPMSAPCLRDKPMAADRLRWEYILRVFFQCNQNVSATARALGMHRRTLQRMLNKRPPPE